jgi:hypothetical protein
MESGVARVDMDVFSAESGGNGSSGKTDLVPDGLTRLKRVTKETGLVEYEIPASKAWAKWHDSSARATEMKPLVAAPCIFFRLFLSTQPSWMMAPFVRAVDVPGALSASEARAAVCGSGCTKAMVVMMMMMAVVVVVV